MSFATFEQIPPIRFLALRPRTLLGLGAARNGMSMGIASGVVWAMDKRHRGGNGNAVNWRDWHRVNPCPIWVIDTLNV